MASLGGVLRWTAVAGVAALALTLVTERSAIAQAARAALVRNQDEPGRNPYSELASCSGSGCTVTFSAVPAGERLVVTSVNAVIGSNSGSPFFFGGHAGQTRIFPSIANGAVSLANTPVLVYYEAGETPQLSCACGASIVSGTLSGYYITLP